LEFPVNITSIDELIKYANDKDYKGQHQAPGSEGSPLYDVTLNGTYPEDIYSSNGARYYGDGSTFDGQSIAIIQHYRNKPNASVTVYRAVPKTITTGEKINEYEKHKKYVLKMGKLPPGITNWPNSSEYYDWLCNEIDRLKPLQEENEKRVGINSGDWVTVSRQYATEHGKNHLNTSFRIISKFVPASTLWTDGNSIHEWGYVG
jgi:hypothetical protein